MPRNVLICCPSREIKREQLMLPADAPSLCVCFFLSSCSCAGSACAPAPFILSPEKPPRRKCSLANNVKVPAAALLSDAVAPSLRKPPPGRTLPPPSHHPAIGEAAIKRREARHSLRKSRWRSAERAGGNTDNRRRRRRRATKGAMLEQQPRVAERGAKGEPGQRPAPRLPCSAPFKV